MFIENLKFSTIGKTEFPSDFFLVLIPVMAGRFKKY